eukprot:1157332-Pelagomonas_calceolata.AAC.7
MGLSGLGLAIQVNQGHAEPAERRLSVLAWLEAPCCRVTRELLLRVLHDATSYGRPWAAALSMELEPGQESHQSKRLTAHKHTYARAQGLQGKKASIMTFDCS